MTINPQNLKDIIEAGKYVLGIGSILGAIYGLSVLTKAIIDTLRATSKADYRARVPTQSVRIV